MYTTGARCHEGSMVEERGREAGKQGGMEAGRQGGRDETGRGGGEGGRGVAAKAQVRVQVLTCAITVTKHGHSHSTRWHKLSRCTSVTHDTPSARAQCEDVSPSAKGRPPMVRSPPPPSARSRSTTSARRGWTRCPELCPACAPLRTPKHPTQDSRLSRAHPAENLNGSL